MAARQDLCGMLLSSRERHRLWQQGITTVRDLASQRRPVANREVSRLVSGIELYRKRKVGALYSGRVYTHVDHAPPEGSAVVDFNCKLYCDNWYEVVAWLIFINEEIRASGTTRCDLVRIRNWEFHAYTINDDFILRKKVLLRTRMLAVRLARERDIVVLLQ